MSRDFAGLWRDASPPPIQRSVFLISLHFTLMLSFCLSIGHFSIVFGADEPLGDKEGRPAAVTEWSIDQLSDDEYSRRQQATLQMWRLRETSRQQVQDASHHPDPEVSGRANWILRQWRRGWLPNTPPEIARLLEGNDDPNVLEELLELGQFNAVAVAIEESAGTIDRELLHSRLAAAISRRFPIYVRLSMLDDSTIDLLRLIDLVADSKEMAVCRIEMMNLLGIDFDDQQLLPRAAEHWTALQRREAKVLVLCVLGRIEEAIEIARSEKDATLQKISFMIDGQWGAIAKDALAAAELSESASASSTSLWCQLLIAADRSNDVELRDLAVQKLLQDPVSEDPTSEDLRWKCLASHGYVEPALQLLSKERPDAAALVASAAARPQLALEILGYQQDQIGTNLGQWIREALEAQRTSGEPMIAGKIENLLSLQRYLSQVGQHQDAYAIAIGLAESSVSIGDVPLRAVVMQNLIGTSNERWLPLLAVRPGETAISETVERLLVISLSEMDLSTWKSLFSGVETLFPGLALDRRVQMVYALSAGEIPREFDRDTDFDRLYEQMLSSPDPLATRSPTLQRSLVRRSFPRYLGINAVSFFTSHGEAELALKCLQVLQQRGDIEAIHMLAEGELDGGQMGKAAKGFDRVWERVTATAKSERQFRQHPEEVDFAAKALVCQWLIARRQGHLETASDLEIQLRLTMCSPSTNLRSVLLEYLGQRGEQQLASEGYQSLLPMTAFGSSDSTELYDVARLYAGLVRETDPAEASRWFDLAIGATLESAYFRPVAYITLPVYVRRWALEAAIQSPDADAMEIQKHLDRIYQLDPMDIDVAERLLPEMRKAGFGELADSVFDRLWQVGLDYMASHASDATAGNNLAWIAAMNQRNLQDALRLSEQAVYFQPDSAIYRDTLAEILFLLDRQQEALAIEKHCLLDDPGQWHLHQQIEKYSDAISAQDGQ